MTMRPCLNFIKNRFKDQIIGAEVGVKYGYNAIDILQNISNLKLLYLIDPYDQYDEWNTPYKKEIGTIKLSAERNLNPFKNRIKWIYRKFENSLNNINHNLDFIYIDGNHSYKYVKKDIELANKITKRGGVIGGHDYANKRIPGVKKAVDEYCSKKRLQLNLLKSDWWIIKDEDD